MEKVSRKGRLPSQAVAMTRSHGSPSNKETRLEPGVHYVCQRCTNCCRWPGDVRLEGDEIPRIASFLNMDEQDFLERFTRLRTNRQGLSLIEKPNHECIMLDGNSCRIHPVKPEQCAGFPNTWNFPGWQQQCEANPVAVAFDRPGNNKRNHATHLLTPSQSP
jgi:uncharacterized protein